METTQLPFNLMTEVFNCGEYPSDFSYDIIIVSDIRMPDEIEYFKNLVKIGDISALKSYRLIRRNKYQIALNNQGHKSETQVASLNVDKEIINETSLPDLYANIDKTFFNQTFFNLGDAAQRLS
jgi:hypothetical protein